MTAPSYTQAAFFDLDKTLLTVNSSFRFGVHLYRNRIIPFSSMAFLTGIYFLHSINRKNTQSIRDIHFQCFDRLFSGKNASELYDLADEFVEEVFHAVSKKTIANILQRCLDEKCFVAILSSSPEFIVRSFAKKFGVHEYFGTSYEVNQKGDFYKVGTIFDGTSKSNYVNRTMAKYSIPFEKTSAYSDSHLDLPFLEAAGIPVAVDPTRILKKESLQRNWQIINT